MEPESEKRLGVLKSWSRFVARELISARRLVAGGLEISPASNESLLAELRALARPYMAILVHKRAKASSAEGTAALVDKRWVAELTRFADNWSHLVTNGTDRAQLMEVLDQVVAEEQDRLATESVAIPVTSRFDTSWAI
jgi:hypothetical protein